MTKISAPTLEALERNDVARLPGGIFSRGFVRTYAIEVGIDPEAAVRDFIEQFPGASVTAGYAPDVEDHARIEGDRRIASAALWLVVGSISVAGLVLYLASVRRESQPRVEPATASSGPGATTPVSATVPVPAASTASASASTVSKDALAADGAQRAQPVLSVNAAAPDASVALTQPVDLTNATPPGSTLRPVAPTTNAAPSAATSADASPGDGASRSKVGSDRLVVHLTAMRACWISAVVDGQKAFARLFQPGEERALDVQRQLVLSIGDAGAVALTLNGTPARPLGRDGQLVTLRLGPGNFKEYVVTR